MMPARSSRRIRRRQGEGDRATRAARSERLVRPSSCRTARIFRSVASSDWSCVFLRNDPLLKRNYTHESAIVMLYPANIGNLLPDCDITLPATLFTDRDALAMTTPAPRDLSILAQLERKVLWLAAWTIHHANHVRENTDGPKVGGHQASCASLATIMTALYFHTLRPHDRVAVKPHASPNFHAIKYLLGRQTRAKLEACRGYKGAQSYPSRTKDADDVDFSTGSVGLGVAQTLFSSLTQDYVRAHGWSRDRPEGRMIALVGDAELDEGNIFEAILEGWKQGLRNCWWVIDYNRQSLDAVVREGLWERYQNLFRNFGWDVVVLKYGALQQAAFREPGGEVLRQWIDRCPNQLYSALVFRGGAAWRKRLLDEIGDQGPVTQLIERRSDEQLARLMTNLGGH